MESSLQGYCLSRLLYILLITRYTTQACNEDLETYERCLGLGFSSVARAYAHLWPGRLASVVEGAGKRRIFAIGGVLMQGGHPILLQREQKLLIYQRIMDYI